jgi:PadR family transcriptional regulator, regulatory protein PadR
MAKGNVRITTAVARVLRQFLEDPGAPRYGFDLMRATGLASGTLYVILARLEQAGWLVGAQEEVDPASVGRPARRLYRLTADGVTSARVELAALSEQLRPPTLTDLRPRLQGAQS